jgi:hypothetical protein
MSPVMNGVPPLRDLAAEQQVEHMVTNLRLLNDTLASTAMAGRYWMFAGLVLGWAREGKLLSHDCKDADFAYLGDDEELLQSAFPILAEAGFQPMFASRPWTVPRRSTASSARASGSTSSGSSSTATASGTSTTGTPARTGRSRRPTSASYRRSRSRRSATSAARG